MGALDQCRFPIGLPEGAGPEGLRESACKQTQFPSLPRGPQSWLHCMYDSEQSADSIPSFIPFSSGKDKSVMNRHFPVF